MRTVSTSRSAGATPRTGTMSSRKDFSAISQSSCPGVTGPMTASMSSGSHTLLSQKTHRDTDDDDDDDDDDDEADRDVTVDADLSIKSTLSTSRSTDAVLEQYASHTGDVVVVATPTSSTEDIHHHLTTTVATDTNQALHIVTMTDDRAASGSVSGVNDDDDDDVDVDDGGDDDDDDASCYNLANASCHAIDTMAGELTRSDPASLASWRLTGASDSDESSAAADNPRRKQSRRHHHSRRMSRRDSYLEREKRLADNDIPYVLHRRVVPPSPVHRRRYDFKLIAELKCASPSNKDDTISDTCSQASSVVVGWAGLPGNSSSNGRRYSYRDIGLSTSPNNSVGNASIKACPMASDESFQYMSSSIPMADASSVSSISDTADDLTLTRCGSLVDDLGVRQVTVSPSDSSTTGDNFTEEEESVELLRKHQQQRSRSQEFHRAIEAMFRDAISSHSSNSDCCSSSSETPISSCCDCSTPAATVTPPLSRLTATPSSSSPSSSSSSSTSSSDDLPLPPPPPLPPFINSAMYDETDCYEQLVLPPPPPPLSTLPVPITLTTSQAPFLTTIYSDREFSSDPSSCSDSVCSDNHAHRHHHDIDDDDDDLDDDVDDVDDDDVGDFLDRCDIVPVRETRYHAQKKIPIIWPSTLYEGKEVVEHDDDLDVLLMRAVAACNEEEEDDDDGGLIL